MQKIIAEDHLPANVRARGEQLRAGLRLVKVGDIRGSGLFTGLAAVADRGSKAPLDPTLTTCARIKAQAIGLGPLVDPTGGAIDGRCGDHVPLAPSFISTTADTAEVVERLIEAVRLSIGRARCRRSLPCSSYTSSGR